MNREIKFRAWVPANSDEPKTMQYIDLSKIDDCISVAYLDYAVDQLMQFTGLIDKNGKEIYQSDLFQVASNRVYEVRWIDSLQVNSGGFETYYACFVLWESDEVFFPFDEFAMNNGEVIGNIYEHIHLLK